MALSNITVTTSEANVQVDITNTTVNVGQTVSNVIVGTAVNTRFIEDVYDAGTLSGNISLNVDNGTIQNITLGGNITGITIAQLGSGSSATLIFTQDSLGGSTLDVTTYASNWTGWDFVNDYTEFDTQPDHYNILNLFNDGGTIFASLLTQDAPQVTNPELANSNVIINNATTGVNKTLELGSNTTLSTDAITEGGTNQFYTNTKARAAISTTTGGASGGGSLTYNNSTGVFNFNPAVITGNYNDSNVATLLAGGSLSSNIITSANISGNYILGNGSQLTGIPVSYTDANVISLFNSYSNAINTSANITSTKKINIGRDDNPSAFMGTGLSIGPLTESSYNVQGFEYLSTRLYGNGTVIPVTDNYASSSIKISGGHNSGNVGTNWITLQAGQNQDPGGIGTGGKNVGLQASFYGQSTVGGTEGVYTDGGWLTKFDFYGDTRITGPGQTGYDEDSRFSIIEYFNINANSLRAQGNTVLQKNLTAGANATSLHSFTGNVAITGNLQVQGNVDYVNSEDLRVKDQSITLNVGNVAQDAMIIVDRTGASGSNVDLRWNETTDKWTFTNDGSTYYNIHKADSIQHLVISQQQI